MTRKNALIGTCLWVVIAIVSIAVIGIVHGQGQNPIPTPLPTTPPYWIADVPTVHLSACCWSLPSDPLQIAVYRNGVRQKVNVDYWLAGRTVVFQPSPAADDTMIFDMQTVATAAKSVQ